MSMGPWTGGTEGYRRFQVLEFEWPRLQTGVILHREVEALTIEVIKMGLLGYVYSHSGRTWYQYIETLHSQGKQKSRKFNPLKDHELPKRIKAFALILNLTQPRKVQAT